MAPWKETQQGAAGGRPQHADGGGQMSVPIKKSLERVPGGMMIVPLLVGAVIHTLFPDAGPYFGSFTGALFDGALTILAVFYVCMGASIDVRSTPYILKKGGALFATKVAVAVIV